MRWVSCVSSCCSDSAPRRLGQPLFDRGRLLARGAQLVLAGGQSGFERGQLLGQQVVRFDAAPQRGQLAAQIGGVLVSDSGQPQLQLARLGPRLGRLLLAGGNACGQVDHTLAQLVGHRRRHGDLLDALVDVGGVDRCVAATG